MANKVPSRIEDHGDQDQGGQDPRDQDPRDQDPRDQDPRDQDPRDQGQGDQGQGDQGQGDQVQGFQVWEDLSSPTMITHYNTGPFAFGPLVDDATNRQTPEQPEQPRGIPLLLDRQAWQEEGEESNEEAGDEQNEGGEDSDKENEKPDEEAEESDEEGEIYSEEEEEGEIYSEEEEEEGEDSDKENEKPDEEAEESDEEGEIHSEEEEEATPLLEQGSEVDEMGLSFPPPAPTERILIDRCTSPLCPIRSTIPHNRGLYLHNGQPNPYGENDVFGLSNPPPAVWFMLDRMRSGTDLLVDRNGVRAFRRNHEFRS